VLLAWASDSMQRKLVVVNDVQARQTFERHSEVLHQSVGTDNQRWK
jgi:hypothetical protein